MGDIITCKCVLVLPPAHEPQRAGRLYLVAADGKGLRIISAAPAGGDATYPGDSPIWRYEIRDGRMHLTPSLLCTDSGFHTDYNWSCDFETCPPEVSGYDRFKALNPGVFVHACDK